MPNVAAALGLGTFLVVPGTLGGARAPVEGLFALAGEVVELDERALRRGHVARRLHARHARAARRWPWPRPASSTASTTDVAGRLAVSGVHGAAAIIAREGDPAAVVTATATPGGMTAAAIEALEERDLAAAVHAAVAAATARAKELA